MRITVKLKLGLAFAAVIALSGITAWLGINNLASLNARLDYVAQVPAQRMLESVELSKELLEVVRAEKNLILSDTKDEVNRLDSEVQKLRQDFTGRVEAIDSTATVEAKPIWAATRASWQHYIAIQDKIIDAVRHDDQAQARQLSTGPAAQALTGAYAALQQAVEVNQKRFADAQADAQHEYENARFTLITVVLASILISVATGAWIALGVSRGLNRATLLAEAVAIGDLDQKVVVASNDEIKDMVDALDRMTANLRATANVADAIGGGDFTMEAKRLSDKDTLGISLERMTANLRTTARIADAIGAGDLTTEVKRLSDKDTLGIALERMTTNLRATAKVADAIADGDLTTEVKRLSEKDTLGIALERMTANLRATAKVADTIAGGDFSLEARRLSDRDTLGIALDRMTTNLRATAIVADAIADGNLTTEAKRLSDKDALGTALERMLDKLRSVVTEASNAAENVSSGSQQLSSSSGELSQGATEQASAAEEASASMRYFKPVVLWYLTPSPYKSPQYGAAAGERERTER
jgi:methyl-accepting chemotaxis protein